MSENPRLSIDVDELELPALLYLNARGNGWSKHREVLEGKLPQAEILL